VLDGGCPWYATYETKDRGHYFAVGALEPAFYQALLKGLGLDKDSTLPSRDERRHWPELVRRFAARFREKTRHEWEQVFDGSDACATPVLDLAELEQAGYDLRLPVDLRDTPGKPYAKDDGTDSDYNDSAAGGWRGVPLAPGQGAEESLHSWLGWTKGVHYHEGDNGVLLKNATSKL
jgi:alpha-methylacyl-CoA racemase